MYSEAHIPPRQLETPGVSLAGGLLPGLGVLSHQGPESLLHLGSVSSAPDLLMTHCSQGNYSARETCPRGSAQGNF